MVPIPVMESLLDWIKISVGWKKKPIDLNEKFFCLSSSQSSLLFNNTEQKFKDISEFD